MNDVSRAQLRVKRAYIRIKHSGQRVSIVKEISYEVVHSPSYVYRLLKQLGLPSK